jgi:nickel-dependent lactate racemase
MRIGINYGQEHIDLEVPDAGLARAPGGSHRAAPGPALADPGAAARAALEAPLGFPPLRRALTPDDHVVVVVEERLPHLIELVTAVLEHVARGLVPPEAVTLLCPTGNGDWCEDLPDAWQDVHVETHAPSDRRRLSYLATTRRGRRLYLNRTAVDADQLVLLTRRRYQPALGYGGGETALFPALADEATLKEMWGNHSPDVVTAATSPLTVEAVEVAWLLGAPFLLQVIEGSGDDVSAVVAGPVESSGEGRRLLDDRWKVSVERPVDTVVAAVSGDPRRQDFGDLAVALASAARVVEPGGRIILLSRTSPALGRGAEVLLQAEGPEQALDRLRPQQQADSAAASWWADATRHARVYLLSGLPDETAEELFTTPLEHAGQAQRLLAGAGSVLFLDDAHKTLAVVQG